MEVKGRNEENLYLWYKIWYLSIQSHTKCSIHSRISILIEIKWLTACSHFHQIFPFSFHSFLFVIFFFFKFFFWMRKSEFAWTKNKCAAEMIDLFALFPFFYSTCVSHAIFLFSLFLSFSVPLCCEINQYPFVNLLNNFCMCRFQLTLQWFFSA